MNTFGSEYIVDNNTVNHITRPQFASRLFRECAHLPSEVLYEARDSPHIAELQGHEYPTTPAVLVQVTRVMATIPADDTKLINLYANEGGADPFIIACALDAREQESQYLDAKEWAVVTGDKAVRCKAEEFGFRVLDNAQFAALIDSSVREGGAE